MSTITAAVGRAATAVVKQWRGFAESRLSKSPEDFAVEFATTALTAALDVEEMARALHADDMAQGFASLDFDDMDPVAVEWYRSGARAIRASILGQP